MDNLQKIYQFIKDYTRENNYSPTVREICQALKFNSTATAVYYLKKLEDQNLILRNNNKNRAIEIVDKADKEHYISMPILGQVAAGMPILAVEDKKGEIIISDDFFRGQNFFLLQVKGESMINAGILNDDYIVVSKQNVANNGEIIVAMLDGEVTVKRFYKENDIFRLQPENSFMQPIYCKQVEIIGKVTGLIRHI